MDRKKILIINTVGLNNNGITQVIFDYYSRFDLNEFEIDIISGLNDDNKVKQKFESNGIHVYKLASRKNQTLKYINELYCLCKKNRYNLIHIHGNSATMTIELIIARLAGISSRIVHVHNSTCDAKIVDYMLRPFFYHFYTEAFACGNAAGNWMYGRKKFTVIKNGRDINHFSYDESKRQRMREKLNIDDTILAIGNVGNFNEQKNHYFLINVFKEINRINSKAKLYLAGHGHLEDKVKKLVCELGLEDSVVFLGTVENIQEILQAMDIMVLPSKHEGLPLVVVEWQLSGLPCIISDTITSECVFTDFVKKCSLNDDQIYWAKTILDQANTHNTNRSTKSIEAIMLADKNGYNIDKNVEFLMTKLKKMIEENSQQLREK